ncbi:MAG TPA: hypothetical protein VF691_12545 [Cytophagaceae bacterium]|jgi:hypothetical protein
MRFIPTFAHGVIDYTVGSLMTSSPLMNIFEGKKEQSVLFLMGSGATVYSLFTDYELGASRKLPVKWHLGFDILSGAFLAASPWLLNLSKKAQIPFVLLGLFEISAGLLTKTNANQ